MEKECDKQGKPITEAVLERLLLSKGLLSPFRYTTVAAPDRQTLATHILTSHDAAELALAGIAQHIGKFPSQPQVYLMDLFLPIGQIHPEHEVEGKEYFNQLNRVRIGIKHHGVFPDQRQWYRVAEKTYEYMSGWCQKYIGCTLDELDESSLLADAEVKRLYHLAIAAYDKENFREALEFVAQAELILFGSNALRGLAVGKPKAEDAIKLSAYGVNANDFLALQAFLPSAWKSYDDSVIVKWNQAEYGHPANWHKDAVDFCLRTFLSVALRIQHAQWTPSAIEFNLVYEYEITILRDGIKIQSGREEGFKGLLGGAHTVTVRELRKGEVLRGYIKREKPALALRSLFPMSEEEMILSFLSSETSDFGRINAKDVSIKCVPKKNDFVEKYYPNLTEIEARIKDVWGSS